MSIYIITCPICKRQYKLTPKDPSVLVQKIFSCPNCRYSTPFTTLIKDLTSGQPITRSEKIDDTAQIHSETKVSVNRNMQTQAYISISGSNSRFILTPGQYVLGRKSSDSSATLQLTPDISMSRQHAKLVVQYVGGKLMAQIVGLKANNPIFVNGKMYLAGRPCTLKSGDMLQLGMTRLVFSV